jgi:hypothetical protein
MMCVDLHTQVEATDDKTKFASFDSYIKPTIEWMDLTHTSISILKFSWNIDCDIARSFL